MALFDSSTNPPAGMPGLAAVKIVRWRWRRSESQAVQDDRQLEQPDRPELPQREPPPARQQEPAPAPGEERHDDADEEKDDGEGGQHGRQSDTLVGAEARQHRATRPGRQPDEQGSPDDPGQEQRDRDARERRAQDAGGEKERQPAAGDEAGDEHHPGALRREPALAAIERLRRQYPAKRRAFEQSPAEQASGQHQQQVADEDPDQTGQGGGEERELAVGNEKPRRDAGEILADQRCRSEQEAEENLLANRQPAWARRVLPPPGRRSMRSSVPRKLTLPVARRTRRTLRPPADSAGPRPSPPRPLPPSSCRAGGGGLCCRAASADSKQIGRDRTRSSARRSRARGRRHRGPASNRDTALARLSGSRSRRRAAGSHLRDRPRRRVSRRSRRRAPPRARAAPPGDSPSRRPRGACRPTTRNAPAGDCDGSDAAPPGRPRRARRGGRSTARCAPG